MRDATSSKSKVTAIRLFLVLNSVLLICLLFVGYFLLAFGFYTGSETLSETARDNLMERQSRTAVYYFAVQLRPIPQSRDEQEALDREIDLLQAHFSKQKTNFRFAFRFDDPRRPDEKTTIFTNTDEPFDVCYRMSNEQLMQTEEGEQMFRDIPDLTLVCGVHTPPLARDSYFYADRMVNVLQHIRFLLPVLFLLCALAEGWLWTQLCMRIADDADDAVLRGIHRTPIYLLLMLFAFFLAGILYALRPALNAIYTRAVFADSDPIRTDVFAALLLLALLAWMTSILVSTVRYRLAAPQWWKQSIIFHAANLPQSERWVFVAAAAEITVFLLLFLPFNIVDARAYLLIDCLFSGVLILLIYFRAKNLSGIFRAVHRVVLEEHGAVPTRGLHGRTLRHVQNVNYLSESAGEQMQRRFVNESFGTELIHNVTRRLRDPLTALIKTVDQLRAGTLDKAQAQHAVERVNRYSQELKRSIEDLLRIANASAGNVETDLTPTDASMMVEQTVGEFYDRFRRQEIELVAQTPASPVRISADGMCMWTVFESVLDEYLHCAVSGTRVFLCLERDGSFAHFRFRGTSRTDRADPDADIRPDSLALPTAKVFTDLQGGTFTYSREQDILTVDLRFPLCGNDDA